MFVTPGGDGSWKVETEVDGRTLGQEHCVDWRKVEQLKTRMQQWLRQAEDAERRTSRAA
jgi:hypothetical protein